MLQTILNLLGKFGNVMDLPGSSVRDLITGNNPFDQWMTPTHDVNRASGRDVLSQFGLMRPNHETGMSGWLSDPGEGVRDIGGALLEGLLDPTNLLPANWVGKVLKSRKATAAAKDVKQWLPRIAAGDFHVGDVIGRGGAFVAHDIPGSPFILRRPKSKLDAPIPTLSPVDDIFPGQNIGQAVYGSGDVTVNYRQHGTPAGITTKTETPEDVVKFVTAVRYAASKPQSHYDKLAETFRALEEKGLSFDASKANNLLMDAAGFNPVDIGQGGGYRHGLEDLVIPLAGNTFLPAYSRALKEGKTSQELVHSFRSILQKASDAATKHSLYARPGGSSSVDYLRQFAGVGDPVFDARAATELSQIPQFNREHPLPQGNIPLSLRSPLAVGFMYNMLARQRGEL